MTNTELVERYPFLILRNAWTGQVIDNYDPEKHGTYLDDMPEGWKIAFGEQLCEELRTELIKWNFLDKYYITQVKEKYGGLCWYDCPTPVGTYSEDYIEIPVEDFDSDLYSYQEYYRDYDGKKYRLHRYIDRCKISDIINKYTELSYRTCCVCGKPATKISKGWICPYCDDCFDKYHSGQSYWTVEEYLYE